MIKVAQICISPFQAGVESVVKNIIQHNGNKSIDYHLVTNSEISDFYADIIFQKNKKLIIHGLFDSFWRKKYEGLPNFIKRRIPFNTLILKLKVPKVLAFIDAQKIEILHANNIYDYVIAYEIKKKRPQIKLFTTIHGTLGIDPEDTYETWLGKKHTNLILQSANKLFSACEYFTQIIRMNGIISDCSIIANGIDSELCDKTKITNPYKKSNQFVVVFFGGGRAHQKGGDMLLKAAYILKNEYKITDFKIQIFRDLAPTSIEHKLTAMLHLEKEIEFLGFVPSPGHLKYLNEADLFVLPSRHEGVANTLMEAIGLNKAIVATNVGGTAEVYQEVPFFQLANTTAKSIASKIKVIYDLWEKTDLNPVYDKKQYDWNLIVSKYNEFYMSFRD